MTELQTLKMTDKSPVKEEEEPHEFDDVFRHIKSFGWYQRTVYFCSYFIIYPIMLQFQLLVFAMGTPHFHCDVTNTTCPPNQCCDNCTSYTFDGPFTSTVSEWNLICDRASLAATIQSCFFGGMLVACVLTGPLSDTFGRKKCIFICFGIMGASSIGASFVHSVPVFAFLQLCVGFGQMGTTLALFVFGVELVGPDWRTLAGNINGMYWEVAGLWGVLVVYYVREWRTIIVVFASPIFLLFLFTCVFPESARFLVSKGRLTDALNVLKKYGGKTKGPVDLVLLRTKLEDIRENQIAREKGKGRHTPLDLFRTPKMRKWSIVMGFNWFVTSMMDFAMFLSVTSLFGNIYVNAALMRIVALIMLLVAWAMLRVIGRRICNGVLRLFAGVLCLLTLVIPDDMPMTKSILAIIGYSFNYATWTTVYLITSELFPTVLRNTALGTGSTCARVGAIIAPYMAILGHLPGVGMSLPITIFGIFSLLAAIATYWIPETIFSYMHQTIDEAETAQDYYGMPCCLPKQATEANGNKNDSYKVKDMAETALMHESTL